jgi:HlyD family secretion protein
MCAAVTSLRTPSAAADEVLSSMDRQVVVRWITRRRVLVAAGIGLLVALAALGYSQFALARTITVELGRVTTSAVKRGVFEDHIPATGVVVPKNTAFIDAVEGGQIAEILVEEGARVDSGQPLVRLKNTNLRLEVLGREAQLLEQLDRLSSALLSFQQARLQHDRELIESGAQIEQAERLLARRKALQVTGTVAVADIDDSELTVTRLRKVHAALEEAADVDRKFQTSQIAQIEEAIRTTRRNLAMIGESLESLTIRAPFAGQLTVLDAHLGESKAPGQRIGQLDRPDEYKVEALLDEFYLARVTVGQEGTARIGGDDRRLRIAKVYPHVRQRQFKVDLTFEDEPGTSIRRGQTLQIRLRLGESAPGLVVGNGAFYDDTGGRWVFVLAPGRGTAERRDVKLGRRNSEEVEVVSGLAPGEEVVTSSYEPFRRFDRIRFRTGGP